MASIAIIGVIISLARFAGEFRFWTLAHGWNTSVLARGCAVVIRRDVRTNQATIPTGTQCVVVYDGTDEDSAYPYREVGVRVIQGPHSGLTLTVERIDLRVGDL